MITVGEGWKIVISALDVEVLWSREGEGEGAVCSQEILIKVVRSPFSLLC